MGDREKIRRDLHRMHLAATNEQKLHPKRLMEDLADKNPSDIKHAEENIGDAAYKHDQWDGTHAEFHVEALAK